MATTAADAPFIDPDEWQKTAPRFEGSWWVAWSNWLAEGSSEWIDPPPMGTPEDMPAALAEAPGTYVFQR
jgi:polyhydroxyalkanoate synthase